MTFGAPAREGFGPKDAESGGGELSTAALVPGEVSDPMTKRCEGQALLRHTQRREYTDGGRRSQRKEERPSTGAVLSTHTL